MAQPPKKSPSQKRSGGSGRGRNAAGAKRSGSKKPGSKPASKKVEIFTASFCPHCQDAKFYFKSHRIPYIEYNLERSKEAEKKFRGYGGKAIPLIIVKGKLLRRWDQAAFEKLYRS